MHFIQALQRCFSVLTAAFLITVPLSIVFTNSSLTATVPPPSGKGAPKGGTVGGGSRPVQTCAPHFDLAKISSLIVVQWRDRAQVNVSLPQTTAQQVEFSLLDTQETGLYQKTYVIGRAQQSLVVDLTTLPSLNSTRPYQWKVALVCNEHDRTEDWVASGWIEPRK